MYKLETATIRLGIKDDHSFIYASWLKSYRQSHVNKNMSNDVFFYHHKKIIADILAKPTTIINVMCDSEDTGHIFAYCVYEKFSKKSILHYVYTKHSYRKLGLATALLTTSIPTIKDEITFITHEPRDINRFRDKFNVAYNPYLLKELP